MKLHTSILQKVSHLHPLLKGKVVPHIPQTTDREIIITMEEVHLVVVEVVLAVLHLAAVQLVEAA